MLCGAKVTGTIMRPIKVREEELQKNKLGPSSVASAFVSDLMPETCALDDVTTLILTKSVINNIPEREARETVARVGAGTVCVVRLFALKIKRLLSLFRTIVSRTCGLLAEELKFAYPMKSATLYVANRAVCL